MCGTLFIEADSLEEAISKAIEDESLPSGNYVHDSFEVNEDAAREMNFEDNKAERNGESRRRDRYR
jgi:hypothetical protein